MRIIEAIGVVSKVVPQEILTDIRQLKEFDVDIVTIGDDWRNKYLEGLEWMKSQPDKQVVYLPYTGGISTTSIKKTIIDNANAIILANLEREQRDWTGKDNTNSTPEK